MSFIWGFPSTTNTQLIMAATQSSAASPTRSADPFIIGSGPKPNQSNPGVFLGVMIGLIIFFSLLCAWCCKRRCSRRSPKQQQVAGYPLPNFSGQAPYPHPQVPAQVVVHGQGPSWPGYSSYPTYPQPPHGHPYHYGDSTGSFAPRQITTIPEAYGAYGSSAGQHATQGHSLPPEGSPVSGAYYISTAPGNNSIPQDGLRRLSVSSRFPITQQP